MEGDKTFNHLVAVVCENNLETVEKLISSLKLSEAERFESFCLAVSYDLTEIVKLMLASGFEFVNKDTGECPAFQSAAFNNNIEIIQILLEKGLRIDPSFEKAVLYLATCQDNATVIKLLLDQGVDILAEVKGPFSCVHIAVEEECLSVLEFFLTNGADVNTRYPSSGNARQGDSLLHRAVLKGSEALVELLLYFNARVNIKSSNGATPLHIAAEKGFYKIANSLIARANVNEATTPNPGRDHFLEKFNENKAIKFFLNLQPPSLPEVIVTDKELAPLHVAVLNDHENIVRLLLEHNANVDAEDSDGDFVLQNAVERGNLAIIDLILSYSPNRNEVSNRSALNFALQNDGSIHKKIVNKLLDYGMVVDSEDVDLHDLLFDAVHNSHLKIVDDLLNRGVGINKDYSKEKSEDGMCIYVEPTLLHSAVRDNNKDMVELLVNRGANVNAKPGDEPSPIMCAIENNNSEMAKFLLNKGACVKDDDRILITAVEEHLVEIVKDLLSMGVDVNKSVSFDKESFNYFGYERFQPPQNPVCYMKSALFVAAEKGYDKVAKVLIENGAEMNFETFYGISPLLVAVIKGHFKTVNLLLKFGANRYPFVRSDSCGRTALHLAAENGHKEIASLLIRYGAKVDHHLTLLTGATPLFFACKNNHFETVETLLKFGANICAVNNQERTPLFISASCGLHEMVKFLFDRGGEAEVHDCEGWTPLLISAAEGHLKCVDVLLECGANIHLTNFSVETALHFAAKNGHADIVKLLLQHDAKINYESTNLETPLSFAVKEDHRDVVEILLKSGANPNAGECSPLYYASLNGQHEIVKLLLKYGARADPTSELCDGESPVYAAAGENHIDIVETLLKAGINNCQCTQACNIAAERYYHEIVELLLDNGASLDPKPFFINYGKRGNVKVIEAFFRSGASANMTDHDEKTSLHYASSLAHLDLVKLLLDNGAKVDSKTKTNNNTPLHYSAAKGHLKIAEVLLLNGADVNFADCFNRTALFFAAEYGRNEMVKFLLESGANVNPTPESETDKTPLLVAAERGYFGIVKTLLQYGARADDTDVDGFTAFYFAVEFGNEKAVELLLQKGTCINFQTINDLPIILLAAERGHLETLEVLLKYGVDTNVFKLPTEKTQLKKYYREKIPEWKPQVFQCILDFSYIAKDYGCADSTDELDRLRLSKFNIPSFFKIFSNLQTIYENDPDVILSNYYSLAKLLVYHTVKMRAASLYTTEGNLLLTVFSEEDQISEHRARCVAEVESMKSEFIGWIGDTNVSLYNILAASLHQLARYAKNPDIVEYFSSIGQDLNVNFPIYCNLIKSQFRKGRMGRELQDKVTKILYHSSLSEKLPSQGHQEICIENILNYLSIQDFRNVVSALPCKSANSVQ